MAPHRSDDSFAGWWLGGFGCAGAITAGVLTVVFGNVGLLASAGIAALGAIIGVVVGLGVAAVLVLLADELGWDEDPPTPRIGRLYLRLDHLADLAGWIDL